MHFEATVCALREQGKTFREISRLTGKGLKSVWLASSNRAYVGFLDATNKARAEKSARASAIKSERGCCKCGNKDHRCLQFDHRDPSSKSKPVSVLLGGTYSWSRILSEINKCDVICANCHMIKHYEDGARNRNQVISKRRQ